MKKDKNVMNAIANVNWKDQIGAIAGPFQPTDTKQSWLGRASRRANISLRHITSLYYGHAKDPKYSVASRVLSAADQARIEKARRDVEAVSEFYRIHAQRLETIDADFHREQIDGLLTAARQFGSRDSAGN